MPGQENSSCWAKYPMKICFQQKWKILLHFSLLLRQSKPEIWACFWNMKSYLLEKCGNMFSRPAWKCPMRLRYCCNCTIYTWKRMFHVDTIVLLDLFTVWWLFLFMKDLMLLCRRVRNHCKSDVILLIKAAQHEHVLLGHDPVSAYNNLHPQEMSWRVDCWTFPSAGTGKTRWGQPVWFCYVVSCAITHVQSHKVKKFLFQMISAM